MKRNVPLRSLFALAALALPLAACGEDSAGNADQPIDTVADTTPDTQPPDAGPANIPHPVEADEVVIQIAHEGGFMMIDAIFRQVPQLIISGDGQRFVEGPQIEIYPGPLLPNVLTDQVDEAEIQRLLNLAAEYGLLADREYERPDNVADAADTVVTIQANGETFVHSAYALGIGVSDGPGGSVETGARADLAGFIAEAMADTTSPDQPDGQAYEPDTYLVRARVATDDELTANADIEPTFVDWPADASASLADASECVSLPAGEVEAIFSGATTLTYFVENDVQYALSVKPLLPGGGC